MKTLYVTDLDGTLLNPQAKVSEYSVEVINRLVEEGMHFTYATARSLVSSSVVTKGLTTKIPVIAYNGAFIFQPDTGEVLHSVKFSPEEIEQVQKLLEKNNISPLVYSVIEGVEKLSWDVTRENDGIRNYLSRRPGDRRLRPLQDSSNLYQGEIFYFTCVGCREELQPLNDEMLEVKGFSTNFQKELYQPEYFYEIMPAQATKAKAILKLKEIWECDRIVSFGDARNDIPMFQISDECYAMENAVDELKKLATGIIGSNEEDGVARWLEQHFITGGSSMQDFFEKDRYNFTQLINKIREMETVANVILDEETDIEIYEGDKVSKDVLIEILHNFNFLDNLVQDECKKEYEKNHSDVENYQFAPSWIKVSDNGVVIGYWGIKVNSDFDKTFVKIDGKWRMK